MSYRPITDTMILARPKLKPGKAYYGAYPAGFPERARIILGAGFGDQVVHVCAGHARHYLYRGGFGPCDVTLDADPGTEPDFCQDARDPWPFTGVRHILMDPPYSTEEAAKYRVGAALYPRPCDLLRNAFNALRDYGRVGILHFSWVQQPRGIAERLPCIGLYTVYVGQGNKPRVFTVFEKLPEKH